MTPVPLFVELCAGTAALSLRLHQAGARPPVSRMGSKSGYADAILRVLGLRPGQGAQRYLWCEPDPGVRLLLEVYRTPGLAQKVAHIIRKWSDEEPRALWERLQAEGPPRCPTPMDPREAARWTCGMAWTLPGAWPGGNFYGPGYTTASGVVPYPSGTTTQDHLSARWDRVPQLPGEVVTDARTLDPREVARWAFVAGGSMKGLGEGPFGGNLEGWEGETHGKGSKRPLVERLPDAVDALPNLPGCVTLDATDVDPREVARWARIVTSNRLIPVHHDGTRWVNSARGGVTFGGKDFSTSIPSLGAAFDATQDDLVAGVVQDSRTVQPDSLPEGTIAYMDPPYVNTSGYGNDLPRDEVIELARRWADAGAWVVISEQEAIPELVADGWSKVEITWNRKGQRRTFSKQQREWLTLSRPPKAHPGKPTRNILGRKRGKVLK